MRYALALPRTPGIYRISNTITHQFYIGSAKDLQVRRSEHFRDLKANKHRNPRLQHSYNKHGVNAFCFEIVEHVPDILNLIAREQYYLDTLKPEYNILLIAGSRLGSKASEASKRKMSESAKKRGATNTGYKFSEESKILMSLAKKGRPSPNKGKKASETLLLKLSESHKNKPLSEKQIAAYAARKGQPAYNKGKSPSETAKTNMSIAHMGQTPWNKGKKGLQVSHNKGKVISETVKATMKEAQRKRFENPEAKLKLAPTWFVKGEPSVNKGKPSKFKGVPRDPKIIAKTVETKRKLRLEKEKNKTQDSLWDSA